MLSYRHAFHAGNFADLLKHIVQVEILNYLLQKDKPFDYIDTHAGAGFYQFDSEYANKNKEYLNGIGYWFNQASQQWPEICSYLECIKQFNPTDKIQFYPGSPAIAASYLRPMDKAWLFELHPTDHQLLAQRFIKQRQIRVSQEDGFQAMLRLLPCQSRRALVLIDPSYEIKHDYQLIVDNVIAAHRKMPNTIFAIWYPVVERSRIDRLLQQFQTSGIKNIQQFELGISADHADFGMTSAGMLVINPPWTLLDKMQQLLPKLASVVSANGSLNYQCKVLVDE